MADLLRSEVSPESIHVRILGSEGCVNTRPTVQLVTDIARILNLSIKIETILVTTLEQAEKLRFLGSPTVQINGLDIEPSARESTAFGFT
ncbi:hypothetical protein Desti_0347 [Desulfomonile tiedjei DSM 6799]|uniref:Thioredoxin-like fold domain-containing protein n=2 Tax=Desulfomonile tiedjei TaxID=2358 RepID=I4C0J3_DESTA|nr:hypothetical protein [Desulfomonile tiedjei]AFM23084.1 hypothetical protein Desti_0347 [Desulfomonile tiedjei DSM 6799]